MVEAKSNLITEAEMIDLVMKFKSQINNNDFARSIVRSVLPNEMKTGLTVNLNQEPTDELLSQLSLPRDFMGLKIEYRRLISQEEANDSSNFDQVNKAA